ncbi:DMT family transporter [Ancylobacter sp. WKF20]|uniref:DMT family transporter n=1 Tax=Ancylobacter sp. WKF20 TaxID=3039801 RepID=UPI002434396C|nr:DMT family transporter [Ancylobacter sp. WKF20]WGD28416.1 DMT family transporter [Ancylobacter sp. WKF20]
MSSVEPCVAPPPAPSLLRSRAGGFALVLVGAVLWSTAGYFVRLAQLDSWSIVLWRSLFAALALLPFWLLTGRNRRAALRSLITPLGLFAVFLGVAGNVTYILALQLTTVATVMTVGAIMPFVAAALAYLAMREPLTRRFGGAAALAGLGVVITAGAGVTPTDMAGIVMTLAMVLCWGGLLVLMRKHPGLDLTLVSLASALVAALAALPFVPATLPSGHALMACAMLGVLTTGLANVITLMGGRFIRSGEASLVLLLDIVLSPLWVWLAFGEAVGPAQMMGGALVIGAVGFYLAAETPRRAAA